VVSVAPRHGFVTPWGAGEEAGDDEELELHQGIAEQVADELMELGWHAAAIARTGSPDHEIVAAGEEWGADLIVTGSRGIGTLHRLLGGSVAHEVLLHTRSSVLVMRGHVPAPIGALRVTSGQAAG
jgi:nucleotide-binding universal stress UspA family protein